MKKEKLSEKYVNALQMLDMYRMIIIIQTLHIKVLENINRDFD